MLSLSDISSITAHLFIACRAVNVSEELSLPAKCINFPVLGFLFLKLISANFNY